MMMVSSPVAFDKPPMEAEVSKVTGTRAKYPILMQKQLTEYPAVDRTICSRGRGSLTGTSN